MKPKYVALLTALFAIGATPLAACTTADDGGSGSLEQAASLVMKPFGRTSTFTNVSINGRGDILSVAPGSDVRLSYGWSIAREPDEYCPTCAVQYYVGINNVTTICIGNTVDAPIPQSQMVSTFEAPTRPGVYYVHAAASLDPSCRSEMGFSESPDGAIAVIVVREPTSRL